MRAFRSGRLAACLLAAWFWLGSGPARAHAIVLSSEPAVNSVVHGTTAEVVLRFNSRIDRDRSRLLLVRADGTSTGLVLKDASCCSTARPERNRITRCNGASAETDTTRTFTRVVQAELAAASFPRHATQRMSSPLKRGLRRRSRVRCFTLGSVFSRRTRFSASRPYDDAVTPEDYAAGCEALHPRATAQVTWCRHEPADLPIPPTSELWP